MDLTLIVSIVGGIVLLGVLGVVALVAWELLKAPPKGGSPTALPNGMRVQHWNKPETDFLYTEIFGSESAYARGGITFGPGSVIVDAGANIGMFTLYAAMRCEGDATIHAFEPIPSTHAVLSANAAAVSSGALDDVIKPAKGAHVTVHANNYGLSRTAETVTFEHHPYFSVWSTSNATFAAERVERIVADLPRSVATSESAIVRLLGPLVIGFLGGLFIRYRFGVTERVQARLVRLGDYLDDHKVSVVDLLKVDVEGAEIAVLEGLQDRHWPKIQQVTLEVESFAIKDEVVRRLEARGFKTSWFASERERNPGVHSEVSMVYAIRPTYKPRASRRP